MFKLTKTSRFLDYVFNQVLITTWLWGSRVELIVGITHSLVFEGSLPIFLTNFIYYKCLIYKIEGCSAKKKKKIPSQAPLQIFSIPEVIIKMSLQFSPFASKAFTALRSPYFTELIC